MGVALKAVDLLRHHITKENNVLFPMSEKILPEIRQEEMAEEFEKFEREKIGGGRHETFHRFMDELMGIYLK